MSVREMDRVQAAPTLPPPTFGWWEELSLLCCVGPGPGKGLEPLSFPTEVTQLALPTENSLSSLLGSPNASPEQIPLLAGSWAGNQGCLLSWA